ncbi:MAG: glycosyltransferase family 4 protein [Candidatus Nitrohelix vancouverensis]|uniref:Glycosyltransferase family 4 protein n=1 Tax=Candidatus Nitrohelix vancouverensis TaxID=2705534 RepID=A0A7T0C274_9BACT|nr:MAG: glycosyltransferase family 4 protein [Candidatus Nitrohelix vancouverensis]
MKIAVIRQKFVNYGGAESFVAQYADVMANQGHEIHIFANQWTESKHPQIHIHPVPALKINSFIRSLSFAWFAGREVAKGSYDIVQSHERIFHQDIYRAGDGCHRQWLEIRKKNLSPWKRWSLRFNLFHRFILSRERAIFETEACKKVIAISQMVKRDIESFYKVPENKIEVIYNGVDLERFHPQNRWGAGKAVRQKLGLREDEVAILHVGSGFERKGTGAILQATEALNEFPWRLVLLGKADWPRRLAGLPASIRDRIIALDPVDDVENYYAAADIFILPSLYEPFGNANLEALATGLPTVVGKNCGAAEVIDHRINGLRLEQVDDSDEIACALNYLSDKSIRREMGQKARVLAETFTGRRNADEMIRVYEGLLSKK